MGETEYTGVAISGKARSGKDTQAALLLERLGDSWRREALADALKVEWACQHPAFSGIVDGRRTITCYGGEKAAISHVNTLKLNFPKVRKDLIGLGQKRRAEDPDYWIKRVNLQPNCIITDMRFKNEYQYLKDRGFLMVRMECTFETLRDRGCPPIQDPSECELDNRDDFDVVVSNNAGLDVLEKAADEIVQTLYSCT